MANDLNGLIARVAQQDSSLAKELRAKVRELSTRREFGLNFERHTPEQVPLVGRPIAVGDKVVFIPKRGETAVESKDTWIVQSFAGRGDAKVARLRHAEQKTETAERLVEDLVFVADFRDPIYPGLVSTGRVEHGGDKPFHTVINSENYHALEAMLFMHQGQVDAIYIDPPYNTGAKDWKYNNDYVDGEDIYRHSKWLSFMERRLKMAKKLLNPKNSVLIVTIDEKEYLRLGLLLEQTFPEAKIQMVSSVINPMGSRRAGEFSRVDEYIYFVMFGESTVTDSAMNMLDRAKPDSTGQAVRWTPLNRDGSGWERSARPKMFYPLFVEKQSLRIVDVGEPLPMGVDRDTVPSRVGQVTVWPMKGESEARWQVGPQTCSALIEDGWVTVTSLDEESGTATVRYLTSGAQARVASGVYLEKGRRSDGSRIVETSGVGLERPRSVWHMSSHSARDFGTTLVGSLLPSRKFPFPKSLYAVEDTLRFFVADKPDALIVDFFSGSGTTAHAVMRLNKQDGGRRRSISVTNNEVSAEEQKHLVKKGLRQGDPDWEALGICDYITKPRIRAAITGKTPDGDPIKGDYKFTDEFPMAEGFEENVEFFTLTYENPDVVGLDLAFERVAPLLWMRAGNQGRRIEEHNGTFDVADTYGVLFDVDHASDFLKAVEKAEGLRMAYIVTDDEKQFQMLAMGLPAHVEKVRLYESYLRTFEINTGKE